MDTKQLRQKFVDYFVAQQHAEVASSPLVPAQDPTLLFTNAGMVQFKDQFLGQASVAHPRVVSVQRCLRAGGKHNDLGNVGYTARHHTFFEMLGNFSFGDYFKREAIGFCWQFLTQELGLPAEKLWVTVYHDDQESEDIWLDEIGVDPARLSRCGEVDNFWSMGDTGPCGPCSEVFYDHGPDVAGGPPGSPDQDGDRFVEIWNLVFMQYDRSSAGELTPLPNQCVDTGMGLERIAAVMQGVTDNYDIDLFKNLLVAINALTDQPMAHVASRVIADHIRAVAFLIADQVRPSNEGRGYVLRRILRRAACHGYLQGLKEPFLYKLLPALIAEMGEAYPALVELEQAIIEIIQREEAQFAKTLAQGMAMLEADIANLSDKVLPGDVAFKLYDTFGVPLDLTLDIAHQHGLTVDEAGFEAAMAEQRQNARAHQQFKLAEQQSLSIDQVTEFVGYEADQADNTEVVGVFVDGAAVDQLDAGADGWVVLDKTPFYAEGGGQVGDQGQLIGPNGVFDVKDTQKQGEVFCHIGVLADGNLAVGDIVTAKVDAARETTQRNHSATHLLHAALRAHLGEDVVQKGSLVDARRLRLDFSHHAPLTADDIAALETLVNSQVLANHPVEHSVMAIDEAKAAGAMALFGEKYGDEVRVRKMGDFSIELCGGTHVARTGDIGLFKIINETGVAAGVRRVEAVTGHGAIAWVNQQLDWVGQLSATLKTQPENLIDRVGQLKKQVKQLEKQVAQGVSQDAKGTSQQLLAGAKTVSGLQVIAAQVDGSNSQHLRTIVDQIKAQSDCAAVVLACVDGDTVKLIAGVSKAATDRVQAGPLLKVVAKPLGGSGGGRPDMAQGAGKTADGLADALAAVPGWISDNTSV